MNEKRRLSLQVSDAPDLDRIAQRLNDACRSVTLDLAFKVGAIVIRELFSNNAQLWEEQGFRSRSYRALAARGDLMLSASALCRAVGVYTLVERLGGRDRWRHLSASHFQEVLSLEHDARSALLLQAEEQEWPVSRLRAEAELKRRVRPSASPEAQARSLQRLMSRLLKYRHQLARTNVAALSAASIQSIRDAISELRAELTELERLTDPGVGARTSRESDVRELVERRDVSKK